MAKSSKKAASGTGKTASSSKRAAKKPATNGKPVKAAVKGPAKAAPLKAVAATTRTTRSSSSKVGVGSGGTVAIHSKQANKDVLRPPKGGVTPPARIATNDKPAKNAIGLKADELEHYRDLLLAKRRELVGDMSQMEREALQRGGGSNLSNLPIHMADMGTDNYEQEFTLGLMEKDRNLLREINSALAKIQDGTYGVCEGTGKPIGKPRLEAQPWARFSIEYARSQEKRMVR